MDLHVLEVGLIKIVVQIGPNPLNDLLATEHHLPLMDLNSLFDQRFMGFIDLSVT